MLIVFMLSVVMLNVIMPSFVAPIFGKDKQKQKKHICRNIEVESTKTMKAESNTCCMDATTLIRKTLSTATLSITTFNFKCCAKC